MNRLLACILALPLLLAPAAATAQDGAMSALQDSYVEAWTAGDADAVLALFTSDAIFWPAGGGRYDGRDEIRNQLDREPVPESASVVTTHTEPLGDALLGIGIWSAQFPEEAGGEVGGEFVVVAEETANGLRIKRLIAFMPRQMPASQ